MGLLPDFDKTGRLKEEKERPVVKNLRRKPFFRTMDWINLLETHCPSCGEKLTLTSSRYSCGYNACPFSISEFKFIKIVHSLKEEHEFAPPRS
jgi:hypothetical protein